MCNLYSITKTQDAIRQLAKSLRDKAGNLPPLPGIFPDKLAPIVRNAPDGVRELAMLRWGMPTPPSLVKGIDRGVTNIRNVKSPHWRAWLKPQHRCVVPATSFCEPSDEPDPSTKRKVWHWFALREDRPLFFFAGIWCTWRGVRGTKKNPEEGEHQLYGFLTTEPNGVIRPIHSQAMPAILTTPEEIETWMTAPEEEALKLQRPLPDEMLVQVMAGEEKEDAA